MRIPGLLVAAIVALLAAGSAYAIEIRFAMPIFETEYWLPDLFTPDPETGAGVWDALILFAALAITTWLVHKRRSRRGLLFMSVACMAYFGFYRTGCICPVGSTQNVLAGIFIPDVGVSFLVLSFFVLPLLFSLFYGRVFCASVCPLGAIQEIVAIWPIRISPGLERALGMGKYIYLGVATLGVATGAGFFICRYDPFVGLYRMGHSFNMLLAGALILILGMFIARPYCRFLCPYGVLLGWMSRFSKWHLDIPPTDCVSCRLCEDSCPYNAIDMPTPQHMIEDRKTGVGRIRKFVLLAPVIILLGAVGGVAMHKTLASLHPSVALNERLAAEQIGIYPEEVLETETFRKMDKTTEQLDAEATVIIASFRTGSAWLGAFIGLIISLKLIGLSVVKKREIYTPNRETCFSCGRCYPYCPVEEDEEKAVA
jgi:NosR/NirI family nitrous oxide reductase transcriptional regulator